MSPFEEFSVLLSTPGHPLHTRSLTMGVTLREDGRWHVRGDVIDLRKCSFVPMVADIQPAGIIHKMGLEICFDPARQTLDSIRTDQPVVAIEPSPETGGECCRDPAPRLQAFAGSRIDEAFARSLSQGFGGPRGCTHLLTLFHLMVSGLRRAMEVEAAVLEESGCSRPAGEPVFRRSVFVDGFEHDDGSIGLAVQLGDFATQPPAAVRHPLERVARLFDVRLQGRVQVPGMELQELRGAERERGHATLSTAPWRDWSDRLAPLDGTLLARGFAARVMAELEGDPEAELLRDALLQMAPGYIQVVAAITERWFAPRLDTDGKVARAADAREGFAGASLGGRPDSCYMWRADGPMLQAREKVHQQAVQAEDGSD